MNNNLVVNVLLECFLPNPWQPRESEDAEHIKKIALSIAQDGLMQVPVGRWVDIVKCWIGQRSSLSCSFRREKDSKSDD